MKLSSSSLSWIFVPVAAAAGYLGSRHYHATPAAAVNQNTTPASFKPDPAGGPVKTGLVGTWTERLSKCSVADLPGIYADIQQLPDPGDIRRAMILLCARWVELDAPGGLAFFSALEDNKLRMSNRTLLLTEWAVSDPLAALAVISQQSEKEAQTDYSNIGNALIRANPDKFWIWFQHARKPLPWPWGVDAAWQRLAANHLDGLSGIAAELLAAESTSSLGEKAAASSKLEGLYAVLAAAMAEKNPDKAVEWAKQLPESVRNKALLGALEVLVKRSPEKITDYIALLKRKQTSANGYMGSGAEPLIVKAVSALLQKDTLKSLDWLRQNYEKLGEHPQMVCRQFGQGLAAAMRAGELTPEQAFAAVRAAKEYNGEIRSGILTKMWEGLPPEQLATTAKWLTTIESKDAAKLALEGIFPEWLKQDQAGALAFAGSLTDRDLAAKLFNRVAQASSAGLVSTQGERMANALKAIPPDYRAEIAANTIRMHYEGGMMDHSPLFDGPAFSSALQGLPASPATDKAYSQVASAWGAAEPEAALTWATGQPDNNLRKTATGAAVEAWAKQDAWGTSQWVNALPPGETRDTASHSLARSLRKEEPVSAWTWAGSIGDPATRLEAQAAVLREWRNASALDATAAVQGLADQLKPEDHQKLMEALVPPVKAK